MLPRVLVTGSSWASLSILGIVGLSVTLLALSACQPTKPILAVHGDSTALGTREGLNKIYIVAPNLDGDRWANRIAKARAFTIQSTGVGGSPMVDNIERMKRTPYLDRPTIIYDLINSKEDLDEYVRNIELAVSLLRTDKFLIMPQVPRAEGADKPQQLARLSAVNAAVRARWPEHTFTADETVALTASLYPARTRFDGLHRNSAGQRIEAEHIGRWLDNAEW